MSYTMTISLALGAKRTSLSLGSQLFDTSGSNIGSEVTAGFVEIGQGNYIWTYDGFPDNFRGGVKFYNLAEPSRVLASTAINPEDAEYLDVKVSSTKVDVGDIEVNVGHSDQNINVTSNPVTQGGKNIQITTNVEDLGDQVDVN